MKKILIILAAIAGLCVALMVAAVLILPKFIDVESYKPVLEKKVSEATGRDFTLGGDLNVSVFPWVGVSFTDLQLGNPQDFGGGDFVKVASFEARMKVLPLLSKKIEIKKFVLDGPQITLTKRKNGEVSWSFPAKDEAKKEGAAEKQKERQKTGAGKSDFALSSLEIGEFSVTNGKVTYVDEVLGEKKELSGITFKLEDVSLERPISLLFQADIDGRPVAVTGAFGPVGKEPGKGTVKLDLKVEALNLLSVKLAGQIRDAATDPNFDIQLDVSPFSPQKLFETLGFTFPLETADSAVLNKLSASLNVNGSLSTISVSNSTLVLDDSTVKFEAQVKELDKPDIRFSVNLDTINLDRYLPPPAEKGDEVSNAAAEKSTANNSGTRGGADGQTKTKEKGKIDYTPLRKLVLNGNVAIGKLVAHGATVENFTMTAAGKDGIFQIKPLTLDLYQGKLDVEGNFDVSGEVGKGGLEIQGNGIQIGPLLRDSMKKDILEGSVVMDAALNFSGESVEAIKKSLGGKGELEFVDGAIVGIDLAEMARNLTSNLGSDKPKEKPRTDFAELNVPFTIKEGIFHTPDTKLLSPLLRITMLGDANLVTETLDFKVRPKLVATLKGQGDTTNRSGVTVPLLVKGTFAEPKFSADLSAMASSDVVKEAMKDPQGTVEKAKAVEETGKKLLKSFGIGN